MTARHFGLKTGVSALRGVEQPTRLSRANTTPRDPSNLIRFPEASILQRHFDHVQESQPRLDTFEFGSRVLVTVFLSLLFLVPLILAGIIIRFS